MHPLTIEDVLQRDQREKIEAFEPLGYHFIAFRALDENYFRYSASHPVPVHLSHLDIKDEKLIVEETDRK